MIKVLLIDDDEDMLELLSANLSRAGALVYTASNALNGLNQARRHLPDVVVLDILLPDLDGMTACEILRKQPSTAHIPVLMLTALGGQLTRLASFESGASEFLMKPMRPRDFVQRVIELSRRQSAQEADVFDV